MEKRKMKLKLWLFLLATCPAWGQGVNAAGAAPGKTLIKSARADINGDGVMDMVRLEQVQDTAHEFRVRLSVNQAQAVADLEGDANGFSIVDINRAAKGKEIVVNASIAGSGGGNQYVLFWFDGRRVRQMAEFEGEEADLKFVGHGTVQLLQLYDGFWRGKETYALRAGHRLAPVPTPFDKGSVPATVRDSLTLYTARSTRRVAVKLPAGRKVQILRSDLKGWYFVRATNGAQGWASAAQILSNLSGLHIVG